VRTTTVDVGVPVMLRSWGAGRPTFFLHAMGPVSSGAIVGVGVEPLVSAGFEVTAPDLPGYGDTPTLPADDYRLGPLATWMWRVVDAAGLDRVTLVGHSWGGAIACHMHAARSERVEALVLVDSGHLDYADVLGDEVDRPIEDWIKEARDRQLRVADAATLAKELEIDADDPIMDVLLVAMEYDDAGSGDMVSRVRPEAQGRARYHLAHARQSETWETIAAAGTPTLLLLATEPEHARTQNEAAAPRFRAAVPQADVRLVPGATHSLITDLRAEFGAMVAAWLQTVG
jgi:pimeloyl-ACP methyl ester carboxylesterase